MSYIRCTSNPENLYSWGDIDGNTYFNWSDKNNKPQYMSCPSESFDKFMLKLKRDHSNIISETPIVYENISMYEIAYNVSRKRICKQRPWENGKFPKDRFDYLICLQIGEQKLLMFTTTWDYFYENYFGYKTIKELFCELMRAIYNRSTSWLWDIYYSVKERIFVEEE